MDISAKKAKSMKNAEKRRERSKVAARCRRGKESEIFNDLSASLPMPEVSKTALDKASIMRLTLCNLKLKQMMAAGSLSDDSARKCDSSKEEFDSLMNTAMGGFILVCSLDGDVIFASEGITTQLGVCQYEIMGQSIFDFSHQYDHNDIRTLLHVKKGEDKDEEQRNGLFRMKCTVSCRGRNAHTRSVNYKVINCIGRIFEGKEKDGEKWFVSICEPLLHPSDVDIPLNKQTFLSKHSPDMKFEYVDDSVAMLMGYKPEEMLGKSLFEFHHASDGEGIAKSFKSLYEKDQNQTDRYRFLTKGGGWVWIITQATVIHGNNGKTPNSVVCIHFITSGKEHGDQLLSAVQLGEAAVVTSIMPVPKASPVPMSIPMPLKTNINSANMPAKKAITAHSLMSPDEENSFIADLLVGPLLNNATCSTSKIFAPKTEGMDNGFLMPNEDTLVVCKEEPDDLTHLAPMAGDECVPLDVPLLEDLLASLDETDDGMYSFLDPDSEEIPRFEFTTPNEKMMSTPLMLNCDPPMVSSPGSSSSLYSPYTGNTAASPNQMCASPNPIVMDDSFYCANGIPASPIPPELSISVPMMDIQAQEVKNNLLQIPVVTSKPVCVTSTVMKPRPLEPDPFFAQQQRSAVLFGGAVQATDTGPTPSKLARFVPAGGDTCSPERIYILVPVLQARRSCASMASSDSDDSNQDQLDLVNLLSQSNVAQHRQIKELLASMGALQKGAEQVRKRDYDGALLTNRPVSLQELTRQDCEVNAPLNPASELLQGPELLSALETVVPTENMIYCPGN